MKAPLLPPQPGVFLLLRRLRRPLVVLILVYAVAVLGFTVVPGVAPDGSPWRMGFFHAFYFVSFLGTTIGLGEIPHPFSDAQRLWALAAIYATVVAWLYAIGELLSTLQDPLFQRIVHENRVSSEVRRLREPFVLLCGHDDAGTLVSKELSDDGMRLVVVDRNAQPIDQLEVAELRSTVPGLRADAQDPAALIRAGLTHPCCTAVLALTGDDRANLAIALSARLLNPRAEVISVAHRHMEQAAMARAGVDHIVNPHDAFAERLATAIRSPSLHVIYEALTTQASTPAAARLDVPAGRWLICGYGRFGRTMRRHLQRVGVEPRVIDRDLAADDADLGLRGLATDPAVLREAGIGDARGIVVGTDNDIDNLSIAVLARELQPDIFVVMRQNERKHSPLFEAVRADLGALSGHMVAAEVLRIIRAPQLSYFLRLARQEDETWAGALLDRLREAVGDDTAESWSVPIDEHQAPAVVAALRGGCTVTVGDLMRAPDNRELRLRAVPLLVQHLEGKHLLPSPDLALSEGDRLLMGGRAIARARLRLSVNDDGVLDYILHGAEGPGRRLPWRPLLRSRGR